MPVRGDGRSGTFSALPSLYGGYKRSDRRPKPKSRPSQIIESAATAPTITDAVSSIPDLAGRWRADQITGLGSGAAVTAWPDASGYGYTASQGTGIAQPTWQAAAVGGQAAVRFAASNYLDSFAPSGAEAQTVVAVIKLNSLGSTQTIRAAAPDTSGIGDPVQGSGGLQFRVESSNMLGLLAQSQVAIGTGTTTLTTSAVSVVATFDSATTDAYAFYVDGAAAGSGTSTAPLTARNTRIGAHATASEGLDGDIAELIVFLRVLSSTERATVDSYVQDRYGIGAAASVGVSDTAAAADGLAVAASVAAPDTATTSEALTVAAAITLIDTGSGADALSVAVSTPLADSAASVDTVTVKSSVPFTDAGAIADSLTVTISVPLADTGSSTEALTVTVSAPLGDAAVATESITVKAAVPATDAGAVVDVLLVTAPNNPALPDTGVVTESFTVSVSVSLPDLATTTDATTVAASVGLSDAVTAAESFTLAAAVILADATAVVDGVSVRAGISLPDAGTATDSLAYTVGNPLRDIALAVSAGRSRGLTATGHSRTLAGTGRSRDTDVTAEQSRHLSATGRSRTLTATPQE